MINNYTSSDNDANAHEHREITGVDDNGNEGNKGCLEGYETTTRYIYHPNDAHLIAEV